MLRSQSATLPLVLLSLLLTAGTVYTQFSVYDARYLAESEAARQRAVIGRAAPSPRQYRVLSAWLIEGFQLSGRSIGVSSPIPSFLVLRLLQNFAIFVLAALWYRRLTGERASIIALGMTMLAWGMSYAFREGGLELDTYSSVAFYLLAAYAISIRRDVWIPVITFFAALNQELSAAIPFAFLACRLEAAGSKARWNGRTLLIFSLSLLAYLGVFLGLRLHFGWRPLEPVWQHRPGIDLFIANYTHTLTWAKLIWTLNILPLVCLFTIGVCPPEIKRWALTLIPLCFLAVPCFQGLSLTRVVLIPLAVVFVPGALLAGKAFPERGSERRRLARTILIVALAAATVYAQAWVLGPRYLRESQLERHRDVMENRACNPWQYRVLSEGVLELLLRLSRAAGIASPAPAFLLFRLLQNLAIFLLAAALYRRLEVAPGPLLLGLVLLGWGMSYAFYNSDLHFSTYSDIIFYLLVLLALLERRDWWIPPLTVLAALNRETAVFIPLVFLLSRIRFRGMRPGLDARSREILIASGFLYAAAFFGLRLSLGWRSFVAAWGTPGLSRFWLNAGKGIGWHYFLLTVNVIPLLGILSVRRWPKPLVCSFWGIALPWLLAHYFGKAVLEETRFLLLPLAIVFIPGALLPIKKDNKDARDIKDR